MNSYLDKLIGRTIDTLFCSICSTFKILMLGVNYEPKCEKCGTKLQFAVINIKDASNYPQLIKK